MVVALILIVLHVSKHSGGNGVQSQAYVAGWNEIAPADIQSTFIGSTSNMYYLSLPDEPLNSMGNLYGNCQQAFQVDGSGWLESQ